MNKEERVLKYINSSTELVFAEKYYCEADFYEDVENILKENEGLKKQLENCYCNRTDCSGRIKDNKQYDSLMQKVESQQKKFIEYLEDYIDDLKQQKETVPELDIVEVHILITLEENLAKYKEITGVDD